MASIREAPWNKKAIFKIFACDFSKYWQKVLVLVPSPRHLLARHALHCSSSSSAEVAVLVGGYSQMTSQLRSSP